MKQLLDKKRKKKHSEITEFLEHTYNGNTTYQNLGYNKSSEVKKIHSLT